MAAQAAGLPPLDDMVGFGGDIGWETLPSGNVLYLLLDHSDCDGDLSAAICGPLAGRLEELRPQIAALAKARGDFMSIFDQHTEAFIKGLHLAASLGEPVEFH